MAATLACSVTGSLAGARRVLQRKPRGRHRGSVRQGGPRQGRRYQQARPDDAHAASARLCSCPAPRHREEFTRAASAMAPFRAVMQVRPPQRAHGAPALTLSNCGWQANAAAVEPPTWKALGRVAAVSALPFIGFGFCDNSIMVRSSRHCVALFSSAQSSCPPRFFRATSSRRRWEARSVCLPWPLPAAATWFQMYSASASQARSRCVEHHACCCRVALRSRGNASPPCAAHVRCDGLSLTAHCGPDAAAHHAECVCIEVQPRLPQR